MSMEEDIVNIDAKLTQLESTVRQMSDDQFNGNAAIGQVADLGIGDANGSLNSHVRGITPQLLDIKGVLDVIDVDLGGIDATLQNVATEATLQSVVSAIGGGGGFFQEITGITAISTLATLDISTVACSKYAMKIRFVGDTSAATVILYASLTSDFTGILNLLAQSNTDGTITYVIDKPARFVRALVTAITRTSGTLTVQIFASPN